MRAMIRFLIVVVVVVVMTTLFSATFFTQSAMAADTAKLDRAVDRALKQLYASSPAAVELSKVAKAALVFPSILGDRY